MPAASLRLAWGLCLLAALASAACLPSSGAIDDRARDAMAATGARGLALAVFPTLAPELPAARERRDLAAGLGVVVFDGPQGPGFYKGGHDEQTANSVVCLERGRRCVVLLANDVRAEARFADLVQFILGDTGVPYEWEYGDRAGKS